MAVPARRPARLRLVPGKRIARVFRIEAEKAPSLDHVFGQRRGDGKFAARRVRHHNRAGMEMGLPALDESLSLRGTLEFVT